MAPLPPEQLFELVAEPALRGPDGRGPVLVEMLDGFVDAGGARALARSCLQSSRDWEPVAVFDVDLLFDYRARRPPMTFAADHWEAYDAPRLQLASATDDAGTPFLLLSGPEPDVLWERFVAAVELLVDRLGVRLTIGTNAIPMAVPHSRPVGVTAHASRPELVAHVRPWIATVQVPGSASALIEHRLGGAGRDAMGFAVHVPHYLAQSAYPPAALALLQAVAAAGDLRLPLGTLEESAAEAQETIAGLMAQSAELVELVRGLEAQYDAVAAERGLQPAPGALAPDASLPSAEEIGAELERFLAEQNRRRRGDDPA